MKELSKEVKENRKPEYKINPLILNRWSARSIKDEEISDEELMPLFEAAKWAPSSRNGQPWRFIYSKKNTEYWDTFFDFLTDSNKMWCKNAPVLIVIISRKNFEQDNQFSRNHNFDTGAAWENLALEATRIGLVAHPIGGFNVDKARRILEIPNDYEVEIMVAVGKRGEKEALSENLQQREFPNGRKPLKEIVMEGKFNI